MGGGITLGFFFISSLVVAIGVGLLVYIRYRRRLKASLREDSDPSLRNHRGVSPREVAPYLLIILLIIWNANIMTELTDISNGINNLNSNLTNRMNQISNQIDDLEIQAQQWKDESESPLRNWECTLGNYDPASARVEVTFSIVPKKIGKNDQVVIQYGEIVLTCGKTAAGVYSATFLIPLFEPVQESAIVALQYANGSVETVFLEELFDLSDWLWESYLSYAILNDDLLSISYDKGLLDIDGVLRVRRIDSYVDHNRAKAVQFRLVKELNGQKVESQILDWNPEKDYSFDIRIQDHYEKVEESDRLDYYVETELEIGLTVRWPLRSWCWGSNVQWPDCPGTVLDKDGKVLFPQE